MTVVQLIRSDYKKYKRYGGNFACIVFLTQGFWAVFQYRIAHYVYVKIHIPILRQLLRFLCLMWQKTIEIAAGISIPASAFIGHSFYIGHFGGIILNADTIIGANCNIAQGVTIGVSGQGEKRGVPVVGDNVFIGVNSVLIGKINVGNNAVIGACSLLNRSLEENEVALGVPAVVVSEKGSKGYI
jgi:serine O-acetyltransferase